MMSRRESINQQSDESNIDRLGHSQGRHGYPTGRHGDDENGSKGRKEKKVDLVGKIGKCASGRLGLITQKKTSKTLGDFWVGIGLDGLGAWQSSDPSIEFYSLSEYIKSEVETVVDKAIKAHWDVAHSDEN